MIRGYTFDENGAMTTAPILWNVDKMPYRSDWDAFQDHVWECAQCAQYTHEKAAPAGLSHTPPCMTGQELISDYLDTVRMQAADSRWN